MNNSHQQRLGAFGDKGGLPDGEWHTLDAVSAGTCALFDTGSREYLFLVTGTWKPSNERCVSIQSHVYNLMTRYGDDSTALYVCRKDRRSPKVYQYQLGDFDPSRCEVLPPRNDVESITHKQHTVPLNRTRGVYNELNDGQERFIRSVQGEIPMSLDV